MQSDNTTPTGAEILSVSIEKEMQGSYLDYAMSVIVSRALPDARDGLKPVHRRIVYAMNESSCYYNKPYRKSARIVGDVMGKYHPHGDSAIYDALVRMAQDFSLRLPLVDGQGNFGSVDGDSPAAMRYTESRMAKAAHALVEDIDKNTVDWRENYDGSEQEPIVLPAQFPNLLVNGSGGIAVGMATNIPPHNLGEVVDATLMVMDNEEVTFEELLEVCPGPDFPTGGIILGRGGSRLGLETGRGSVIMRGKAVIEEIRAGREAIVITEIPYQVNKAHMVEKIAMLVRDKKVEGISDLRDESDKSGIRVVVELKRDAIGGVVLSQLYKYTPLQTSFGVNMLALDHGRPRQMNLRDILNSFIAFREEVVTRRTNFLLDKARNRAHVLIGLSMAVANIDEVIALIRNAPDPQTAKIELMARDWPADDVRALIVLVDDYQNQIENGRCKFTDLQAKAILEMKLSRLTGLEQGKISEELEALAVEIADYLDILGSIDRLRGIIRTELVAVREQFATPRRTVMEASEFEEDIEDLIAKEDMVVTVTMGGYIKRVPLSTYRAQKRGGKGRSGMSMREEDVTAQVFVANTHTPLLFFSTKGKAYKLKVYKLPLGNPQSKGRALVNVFPLEAGETINVVMPLPEDEDAWNELQIMFATKNGNIRRNALSDFESVRANGKIAMKLDDDDSLIGVAVCDESQHALLAMRHGKALRCPVGAVRVFKGRNSTGVRGVALDSGDEVISMTVMTGAEVDISVRDEYLKIPVEMRIEIAKTAAEEKDITPLLEEVENSLSARVITDMAMDEQFLLTITENGYGKRTSAYEYRKTNRGGKGVVNIVTSERNGSVVASFPVVGEDQVVLVTDSGKLIRCPIHDVRIAGRNTQGVTLFRIEGGEKVVSAAHVTGMDDDEDEGVGAESTSSEESSASDSDGGVADNDQSGEESGDDL